jgi:RNA polymerase sigma factor (sigma-70 family)
MDVADFERYRTTRSVAIRNRLILANLGIVHRIVRGANPGEDLDDLLQAGILGMINALKRFDARKGFGFYGFAKWHVIKAVQMEIRRKHGHAPHSQDSAWKRSFTAHDVAEMFGRSARVEAPRPHGERDDPRASRGSVTKKRGGAEGGTYEPDPGWERDAGAVEARHDLRVALEGATPEELAALMAHADDATPDELATLLRLPRPEAIARVAEILTRARGLCGGA